jgi:hypothetical protein
MLPPEWFDKYLIQDAKKLIWDRTIETDITTFGSKRTSQPWMIDEAISNPRRATKSKKTSSKTGC